MPLNSVSTKQTRRTFKPSKMPKVEDWSKTFKIETKKSSGKEYDEKVNSLLSQYKSQSTQERKTIMKPIYWISIAVVTIIVVASIWFGLSYLQDKKAQEAQKTGGEDESKRVIDWTGLEDEVQKKRETGE